MEEVVPWGAFPSREGADGGTVETEVGLGAVGEGPLQFDTLRVYSESPPTKNKKLACVPWPSWGG